MAEGYQEAHPWKGKKRWKCDLCAFDSLLEHVIKEHVEKYHGENEEEHSGVIVVTDKSGRPKVH